ncbi:MAG: uroporphyrinogen-III C-methyltransferase [Burkholderiales bacterium]
MPGTVYLVGAGPGAADLLTLRAARLLAKADIVFYDALVENAMLDLCPQALKVSVGKRCGERSTAQRFINRQLIDAAQTHACVVRLKGGDPMLFGRAREEIGALTAENIQVEVIPGVSAAFGASADLMQSLTQRGVSRSVLFVTPRVGHGETEHPWAKSAAAADTVVLYMAGQQAGAIAQALMAAGLPSSHPAVMIENATLPGKRIIPARLCDLANAAKQLQGGPALLFIGAVYEEWVAREE